MREGQGEAALFRAGLTGIAQMGRSLNLESRLSL
jgi:hypothetical protein